jgi:hypothetical protein
MRHVCFFVAILAVSLSGTATVNAAGAEHSSNFLVFAPSDPGPPGDVNLARAVLEKAEQFRREIANEILGEELPDGIGRTCINVALSSSQDEGLTWAKDHPDRVFHNLYLTTQRSRALGSTLKHEIAHVVLATRFSGQDRLPAWVEEGIASRYDDPARVARRRQAMRDFARKAEWPALRQVLAAPSIASRDVDKYSCAVSLTRFLARHGGLEKLYAFARDGRDSGWDRAVREHYGLTDVDGLQQAWQEWTAAEQLASAR